MRVSVDLAEQMIRIWRRDGIFQVALDSEQSRRTADAFAASKRFFAQPLTEKTRLVSDLSYAGYVASGEEMTAGEADYSEVFTVCKDLPLDDSRVRAGWPLIHERSHRVAIRLYVRPPVPGEVRRRNWLPEESSAGMYEHEEPWTFVAPVPDVLTVFPGDILQFMTGGHLLSTPHEVRLANRQRHAMAYFHEPRFSARAHPLFDRGSYTGGEAASSEFIHYGSHFTNMFMRCYPERVTSKRIAAEGRLRLLPPSLPARATTASQQRSVA